MKARFWKGLEFVTPSTAQRTFFFRIFTSSPDSTKCNISSGTNFSPEIISVAYILIIFFFPKLSSGKSVIIDFPVLGFFQDDIPILCVTYVWIVGACFLHSWLKHLFNVLLHILMKIVDRRVGAAVPAPPAPLRLWPTLISATGISRPRGRLKKQDDADADSFSLPWPRGSGFPPATTNIQKKTSSG